MRIRVISIGKTNINFVKSAIEMYKTRIDRYVSFDWIELPDVKNSSKYSPIELRKKEGELILSKTKSNERIMLLDENGKNYNSVGFSSLIQDHMNYRAQDMCFVIGGAYGFSDEIYSAAESKISLSKMTFSHQLVRAIFCEQLYRAFSIICGEPYHHP